MLKKGVEPFAKIRRIRRYGLVVESVSLRVGFEVSETHARHILCHSAYELGYKNFSNTISAYILPWSPS